MFLGYTAHSIWDSSHKQIGGAQEKEKKNIYIYTHTHTYIHIYIYQKDILNFKQKTMSVCLSKIIYVSMYVFVFG